MHIRERGNSIQLVRTTYNPTTKSGAQQVFKLDSNAEAVTPELEQALTPDELAQLKDYLAARKASRQADYDRHILDYVAHYMTRSVAALKAGNAPKDPALLWQSIAALQKALKAAGHLKPVRAQSKSLTLENEHVQP